MQKVDTGCCGIVYDDVQVGIFKNVVEKEILNKIVKFADFCVRTDGYKGTVW